MKLVIKISFLVIVSALLSCQANLTNLDYSETRLEIVYDTLTINIKGRLGQIIRLNNKYYCFVERDNPYSSLSFRDFYIISPTGEIEQKIEVSDKMNTGYYNDLHIRNDSILMKDYYDHATFYLDTLNNQWIEIEEVDDLIYEDEYFYVTYLDFGEWGHTVWFKDKKTKKEYELASSFPKIHRIDSVYYLTNSRNVFKIDNPNNLKLCDTNYYYERVEKQKWGEGSFSTTGTENIFQDTVSRYETKFYIVTSFVFHDSLFCICVDSSSAYLGFANKSKIQKIENIGTNINIYRRSNSYRGNQNINKDQLLKYYSKEPKYDGLIEITYNQIKVITVKNIDTANYLGTEKAQEIFEYLTTYHTDIIYNLNLLEVDNILPEIGAYNVTPHHKISIGTDYYPNKKRFELETPRVYKIIEDTTVTLLLNYYYTKNDGSVKVVTYEWRKTNETDYNIYSPENEIKRIKEFQRRLDRIVAFINKKYGQPEKKEETSYGNYWNWKLANGTVILLSSSDLNKYQRIRMKIYNE